jgi:hypothetical protein
MTGLSRRRLLLGGASAACALPLAFGGRAVAAADTVDDAGQRSRVVFQDHGTLDCHAVPAGAEPAA